MISVVLGALLLLTSGQSVNFFSLKQDVEIGSASAREAEQSLQLVKNPAVSQYVQSIGQRLVQNRSLPLLRYRFQVVNTKEISSLGFPGGAIYIDRGLLEIASNDDELAAIVAHEISHVALRHGTAQLSRQLLIQAPVAIAAGLTAADVWKDEIAKLGISLGTDAPFLRYSRDQELEASLLAVRLMAEARFDPNAFRTVLEKVNEAQTGAYIFNHPQAQTLSPEIEEEIENRAATPPPHAHASIEFRGFRSALQKVAYQPAAKPTTGPDAGSGALPAVFTHPMDYYRLGHPAAWQVTRTGPNGAIIAPVDGIRASREGQDVTHGVMVDLFDISVPDRSPLTLEQATNRLIASLRQKNQLPLDLPNRADPRVATSWLRIVPGAQTQTLVSDEPGLRTVMIGKPDGSSSEVAWVVTRLYFQSLFYMVFVAPEDEFSMYQPIFEQMIRSVRMR